MCQKAARSHEEARKQEQNWILEVKYFLKLIFLQVFLWQHDPNRGLDYHKLCQKMVRECQGANIFFQVVNALNAMCNVQRAKFDLRYEKLSLMILTENVGQEQL